MDTPRHQTLQVSALNAVTGPLNSIKDREKIPFQIFIAISEKQVLVFQILLASTRVDRIERLLRPLDWFFVEHARNNVGDHLLVQTVSQATEMKNTLFGPKRRFS